MVFTAVVNIQSEFGDVLRFKQKNSYIDVNAQIFKGVALLNGSKATYTMSNGTEPIILKLSTRKELPKKKGVYYNGQLCLSTDIPYYQTNSVVIKPINNYLAMVSKVVVTPQLEETILSIIRNNMGISAYKCQGVEIPQDTIAFSCRQAIDEVLLRQMLNVQLKSCGLYIPYVRTHSMGSTKIVEVPIETIEGD